ncbi:MAG: flavodoxin family protein [Thermoleophilia bacterium]|nr:flavodoxin family protein [Thermoleophilia bacterium]
MTALVVYESMFGNTHTVAERIARGLGGATLVAVAEATAEAIAAADLVVVGGPTHVHGMVSDRTREGARQQAAEPGSGLTLDPDAEGPTLRDWFDGLALPAECRAAAFDTRVHGPAPLTGRASRGIAKRLERHGATLVAPPESFFVERDNHLSEGEADRAEAWGASLARSPATA